MQPWLDFDVRETGCRRCGGALDAQDVHIWACRERTRRMDLGEDGRGSGHVRYGEISRAYPVCGVCFDALEQGAGMGSPALARLILLVGVVVVLWLAGAPVVHRLAPNFIAAFHRNGATGR